MKRMMIALGVIAALFWLACSQNAVKDADTRTNLPLSAGDTAGLTNDFYDDAETHRLEGKTSVSVQGEIEAAAEVDITKLPKRSVIVKETILKTPADSFTGAFRYDGYSLYDILNTFILKKKNEEAFAPIIDLFVEISNAKGEKVVLSWGEIYYPIHRHEIIIATEVMRIVPSKTKELWTLPEQTRLIVASDLITARNISNPEFIRVFSWPEDIPAEKGKSPLYSPEFKILADGKTLETVAKEPEGLTTQNYPAIFYGRGRGIHSTIPFKGVMIKELLAKYFPLSAENLQRGIFVVVADDGYRSVYTYSEVMNRNDQSELLLISRPDEKEDGIFRVYPAMDFFSDRAVKALTEIRYAVWK